MSVADDLWSFVIVHKSHFVGLEGSWRVLEKGSYCPGEVVLWSWGRWLEARLGGCGKGRRLVSCGAAGRRGWAGERGRKAMKVGRLAEDGRHSWIGAEAGEAGWMLLRIVWAAAGCGWNAVVVGDVQKVFMI